jgi:hypothetical protein
MPRRPLLLLALLASFALALPASAADEKPAGAATVGELVKEHNQALADGTLALRLTVPTTVTGLKDSTVACVVFFADDAGRYVPSRLKEYAGPDGSIRLLSTDTVVASDEDGIDFAFTVPYATFPRREPGRYRVEARARIVLRAGAGNVVLAQGTTRFWVEG